MNKKIISLSILFISLTSYSQSDFSTQISNVADSISKKILLNKTVAVMEFEDLNGDETQLGQFLSDELSSDLSNLSINSNFKVVERSHLNEIFKEKKLIKSVDKEKVAKDIGSLNIADILITATISDFSGYYRVNIKLLDTKNGFLAGAFKTQFIKIRDLEEYDKKIVKSSDNKNSVTNSEDNKKEDHVKNASQEINYDPNDDCAKNNTGDVCFINVTNKSIEVLFSEGIPDPKAYGGYRSIRINLSPNEKSCVYTLTAKSYGIQYQYSSDGSSYSYSQSSNSKTKQINVRKCATEYNVQPFPLK